MADTDTTAEEVPEWKMLARQAASEMTISEARDVLDITPTDDNSDITGVPFPIEEDDVVPGPLDPLRALGNLPTSIANNLSGAVTGIKDIYDNPEEYANLAVSFFEDAGESLPTLPQMFSDPKGAVQRLGQIQEKGSPAQAFTGGVVEDVKSKALNPRKAIVEDPSLLGAPANMAARAVGAGNFFKLLKRIPEVGKAALAVPKTAEDMGVFISKHLTSMTTGVAADSFDIAYRSGRQGRQSPAYSALVAARRTDKRTEDIADTYFKVEDQLKREMGDQYIEDFGKLKIKDGQNLDLLDIHSKLSDVVRKWDMEIRQVNGEWKLFRGEGLSGLPFGKGELKAIEGALNTFKEAMVTGNNSIKNVDFLKKKFSNLIETKRKHRPLKKFKVQLVDVIRKELREKVDGYETLTGNWQKSQEVLDDIAESFKTGSTTKQRISAITQLIRDNPSNSYSRKLMKEIDDSFGINITEEVAGIEAGAAFPKGLIARGAGAAALTAGLVRSAGMLALFPITSPRFMSMMFGGMGIASKKLDNIVSEAWKFANKHDLVMEGATYGDVVNMMIDGLTDQAIAVRKEEIEEKERSRKAFSTLNNTGIPSDVFDRLTPNPTQRDAI